MLKTLRTIVLFTATLLMGFAAFVNATISVPHLREDMLEINVRPTLLRAILTGLHFSTFAMVAFAALVLVAAIQSLRGAVRARLQLALIALTYIAFGIVAFVWSGSHHALGYVLMGILILGGAVIRD